MNGKNNFYYFIENFENTHLTKNIGFILNYYKDNGFNTFIVTNKIIGIINKNKHSLLINNFCKISSFIIYLPFHYFNKNDNNIFLGYPGRFHSIILFFLSILNYGRIIIKTDSLYKKLYITYNPIKIFVRFLTIGLPIRYSNQIIVESDEGKIYINKNYNVSLDKIIIIKNGLPIKEYSIYKEEIKKYIIKENIISFIGRIYDIKGVEEIIIAFNKLNNNDWKLNIIGPIFDKDYHLKCLDISKNNKNIFFLGEMYGIDLFEEMYKSKIGVLFSKNEGFPNIISQQMFFENLIIASDVGEVSYILDNGKYGSIIDNGNINGLVEKLKYYTNNYEYLYNRNIGNNLNYILNEFNYDIYFKKLIK